MTHIFLCGILQLLLIRYKATGLLWRYKIFQYKSWQGSRIICARNSLLFAKVTNLFNIFVSLNSIPWQFLFIIKRNGSKREVNPLRLFRSDSCFLYIPGTWASARPPKTCAAICRGTRGNGFPLSSSGDSSDAASIMPN